MNPLMHVMDRVLYMAGGGAVLGKLDDVVTSASLSKLYGFEIDVVRVENRVFVDVGGRQRHRIGLRPSS